MRRLVFALLLACGGKQAPPQNIVIVGGGALPDAAAPTATDPSGCAPQPGITAETCAAQGQGCVVSAPPYCSGVEQPPDVYERARHGPCACVCPAEIQRCEEVP
jgi:hypothetical protein